MPPQLKVLRVPTTALVGVCAVFLTSCSSPSGEQAQNSANFPSRAASPMPTPTATPSAVALLKQNLQLSQVVGQRIIYAYDGATPPARLRELIRRGEAGGIILFKRNVQGSQHLKRTMRELQSIPCPKGLEAPLLVMVDQEGGLVKRLPGPPFRSPSQVGRAASVEGARREGRETGRYLREHGVNVNLAPVVDVARPNTYQERSGRAYSRSASLVASMAEAFADGMVDERVVPCFKHFPGLGAAPTNEDLDINRMDISRRTLDEIDLLPFKKATAKSMVMTSTGIYPILDKEPALFSRRVVTGELRQKLGFQGISVTDDLEVPALQNSGTTTERGRRAILAGNDLLLYCVNLDEGTKALRGLTKLYEQRKLDSEDLYETTARVLAFRASLAPTEPDGTVR